MSRIADALKRSQTGRTVRTHDRRDPAEPNMEFFVPHDAALETPWAFDEAAAGGPATEERSTLVGPPAPRGTILGLEPSATAPEEAAPDGVAELPPLSPLAREQYRTLAASLHDAQMQHQVKVVMITSAAPDEGKTLTASNLALTLNGSYGRRVVLVDADLRQPKLHDVFRLNGRSASPDQLRGAGTVPIATVREGLSLLAVDRGDDEPMTTLASSRMRAILDDARQRFDWVLIDTPPVGFLPDAHVLAALVDAVIVVVAAGSTPYTLVQRACEAVGRQRVLGIVLNRADENAIGGYGYDDHYGGEVPS